MIRWLLLFTATCGTLVQPVLAQCRPSDAPRRSPLEGTPVPVYDAEPNNTPATANRAWLGTIANGAVQVGDVDVYAIDVPANTTLNLFAQVRYYGSPLWAKLTLYDRDGVRVLARQDSLSATGDRGGRDAYLRHTVTQAGRYFVAISDSNATGSDVGWYSIRLFKVTPSPGDPVTLLYAGFPYPYLMKAGPGGLYVLSGTGIQKVTVDGAVSTFATDVPAIGMAFDGNGDLLVTGCSSSRNGAIWRITRDGTRSTFADSIAGRPAAIAVGPNGDVWVCVDDKLVRFDPAGGVRDTVLTSYLLFYTSDMAFSPSGDLLVASYEGVHKVVGADLPVVIPDGHSIQYLAFDRDGYLYAGQGTPAFPGGVLLYDPQYQLVNDPLARLDSTASSIRVGGLGFAAGDDGVPTKRFFALATSQYGDSARLVELNPRAIRAPGAPVIESASPPSMTVPAITNALLGGTPLTAVQVQYLDSHGNRNGILDVADLRAYLRAQGQL